MDNLRSAYCRVYTCGLLIHRKDGIRYNLTSYNYGVLASADNVHPCDVITSDIYRTQDKP